MLPRDPRAHGARRAAMGAARDTGGKAGKAAKGTRCMSPPHHTNLWSLEEEARLLELAATASRIVDVADAMSKSRNAIVGKLARMRRNGQVGVIEWSLRPNRHQARKQSPRPRM